MSRPKPAADEDDGRVRWAAGGTAAERRGRCLDFEYLIENWREVVELGVDHLRLSLGAVAVALLIAVPVGVLAARFRRLTLPILSLLGLLYTVPSLALLVLLIPIPRIGLGPDNALVALTVYAQIFLVRNIVVGLRGVDPATLEAARGLGMTGWQAFRRVQWPLALPVMLAGLRTATVTTISLATVAAWVDAGGLGTLLFEGLSRRYPSETLAGTVAIVALALAADALLRLAERGTAIAQARRAAR